MRLYVHRALPANILQPEHPYAFLVHLGNILLVELMVVHHVQMGIIAFLLTIARVSLRRPEKETIN